MSDTTPKLTGSKYRAPFIIVTSLFFMWGFLTVLVDGLIPRLRDVFELSYFEAGLVQFSFFIAYLVVSVPGGALISKIGYKRGVIAGLLTMAVGCLLFFPAAEIRVFGIFLVALFVLAAGITILQVAANPYVTALGPAHSAASRLNLAQAFNSLGTTIAPLVSAAFILGAVVMSADEINLMTETDRALYYAGEASAVQTPFLFLALVLAILAGVFAVFKLPNVFEGEEGQTGSYREALRHRRLKLGAIGIFVYVGAEVAIASYLVNYFLSLDIVALVSNNDLMRGLATLLSGSEALTLTPMRLAGTFVFFYWGGAMVGRFIGAYLMRFIKPARLLSIYAGVAMALVFLAIVAGGGFSMWSLLFVGLFNSIMFPTIFALAIEGMEQHTAQASGVLCMAIVGGAIIPPLTGALADHIGFPFAFVLPIACYAFILFYGIDRYRAQHTGLPATT